MAGAAMLLLTGCAGEVNLSEADNIRVAQYAADLLLKYDSNYKERLLTAEEAKEAEEKLRRAAEKEAELQALLEAGNKKETQEYQENNGEQTAENETGQSVSETVVSYNINDVLKTDGFQFTYAGYDVVEAYPEVTGNNQNISMEVRAASEKKLLIVKVNVENTTTAKAECNLFEKDITGSVIINGEVKADSMVTMLLNDLGTLKSEIEPGQSYETVLVFEIPETTNAEQVELNIHMSGETYNIQV